MLEKEIMDAIERRTNSNKPSFRDFFGPTAQRGHPRGRPQHIGQLSRFQQETKASLAKKKERVENKDARAGLVSKPAPQLRSKTPQEVPLGGAEKNRLASSNL
jgi:hypothetical protein